MRSVELRSDIEVWGYNVGEAGVWERVHGRCVEGREGEGERGEDGEETAKRDKGAKQKATPGGLVSRRDASE